MLLLEYVRSDGRGRKYGRMVNSKPAMANYDYTHINFRGGKHLAKILFEALMYDKEQYEKRKAYEN